MPEKSTPTPARAKKGPKPSGREQVLDYIENSDHPLKEVMQAARDVILSAHPEITEHIKWNAPSFCFQGADKVTFNLYRREYLLLVFHTGLKAGGRPPGRPQVTDPDGLLEWITDDRAAVKLHSLQELSEKSDLLQKLVSEWIARSGPGA